MYVSVVSSREWSGDLLGESHGVLLQGPGTEGHSTLRDGSAEQTFTVGRQHLTNTDGHKQNCINYKLTFANRFYKMETPDFRCHVSLDVLKTQSKFSCYV